MKKLSLQKGVTLFIAMVLTATLLLVSTSVVTIAVRETKLANAASESQHAFYIADSGIECALYWDQKQGAFNPAAPLNSISCNGSNLPVTNNGSGVFTFNLAFSPECATITVTKAAQTTIESRGHNTCDTSNAYRVERALRVTY